MRKQYGPLAGNADPDYEGDRLMPIVPLQHTRPRCVVAVTLAAAYAVTGWRVMVDHPAGLCDSDLAGLWPGTGRGPHGRRAGLTRHLARGICGQSLDGVGRDPCRRAAHLRRDPDQYRPGRHPASAGRGRSGASLGGVFQARSPVPATSILSTAGRTTSAAWSVPPFGVTTLAVSGQIPWSLFVMTWWTWWVGRHTRRLHRHAAGAELASLNPAPSGAAGGSRWACRWWWPWRSASSFGYGRGPGTGAPAPPQRQAEGLVHAIRTCLDDYVDEPMPSRVSMPVPLR